MNDRLVSIKNSHWSSVTELLMHVKRYFYSPNTYKVIVLTDTFCLIGNFYHDLNFLQVDMKLILKNFFRFCFIKLILVFLGFLEDKRETSAFLCWFWFAYSFKDIVIVFYQKTISLLKIFNILPASSPPRVIIKSSLIFSKLNNPQSFGFKSRLYFCKHQLINVDSTLSSL